MIIYHEKCLEVPQGLPRQDPPQYLWLVQHKKEAHFVARVCAYGRPSAPAKEQSVEVKQ